MSWWELSISVLIIEKFWKLMEIWGFRCTLILGWIWANLTHIRDFADFSRTRKSFSRAQNFLRNAQKRSEMRKKFWARENDFRARKKSVNAKNGHFGPFWAIFDLQTGFTGSKNQKFQNRALLRYTPRYALYCSRNGFLIFWFFGCAKNVWRSNIWLTPNRQ